MARLHVSGKTSSSPPCARTAASSSSTDGPAHIRGGALTEASGRLDHNGCRNEMVASDGAHGGDVWSMGGSEIPSLSTFRITDAISFLHCASEHTSRRRRIFESTRKPVSSFGLGLDIIEVQTAVWGWPGSSRLLVLERHA